LRNTFITEYLTEADEIIKTIKSDFPKIATDLNKKQLLISKVQSCLSLLRSCLDYCCQDIYNVKIKPIDGLADKVRDKRNKYFPYGRNEQDFKSMIGASLPKIKQIDETTYNLIESIQPYKTGDDWLYYFCTQTNIVKHDSPKQIRKDKNIEQFIGGNAIRQSGGTIIIDKNSSVNGKVFDKDIAITMNTPIDELINEGVDICRVTETCFEFEKTGKNVIELLETTYNSINRFYPILYKHLNE
jgi:hypothetical protein